MYNSSIKDIFIRSYYKEAQKDATNTFNRTSLQEEICNKDIAEFSNEELIETLISMKSPTVNALAKIKTTIKQYTTWASNNGNYTLNDSINQISRQELMNYLDSDYAANRYIKSRDELYVLYKKLANPVDQAILVLLFEGLDGEDMSEIRLLKKGYFQYIIANRISQ